MRFVATLLLWLVTTVALAVAVPAAWAQRNVVDADGYAALAQRAAGDPALQSAAAAELTTQAMRFIEERGSPPQAGGTPTIDSSLAHGMAAAYTAGPAFPAQFAQANRVAHRWMFTDAAERSSGDHWVVDVAPMLNSAAFEQMLSSFNVQVPSTVTVPVTVSAPEALRPGQLRQLATWGPWVSIGVVVLTGVAALLMLAAARNRGKALTGLGVSALLVGAAGWAAIEVARRYINDALNHTAGDVRAIADAMVGHAEGSLHQWLNLTLTAGGVLVVFGVIVATLAGLRRKN